MFYKITLHLVGANMCLLQNKCFMYPDYSILRQPLINSIPFMRYLVHVKVAGSARDTLLNRAVTCQFIFQLIKAEYKQIQNQEVRQFQIAFLFFIEFKVILGVFFSFNLQKLKKFRREYSIGNGREREDERSRWRKERKQNSVIFRIILET